MIVTYLSHSDVTKRTRDLKPNAAKKPNNLAISKIKPRSRSPQTTTRSESQSSTKPIPFPDDYRICRALDLRNHPCPDPPPPILPLQIASPPSLSPSTPHTHALLKAPATEEDTQKRHSHATCGKSFKPSQTHPKRVKRSKPFSSPPTHALNVNARGHPPRL